LSRATHGTIFIALCIGLTGGAEDSGCDVMSMQESRSHDWEYIVIVWEICCYDTTGYTPMANRRKVGHSLPETGNLLLVATG